MCRCRIIYKLKNEIVNGYVRTVSWIIFYALYFRDYSPRAKNLKNHCISWQGYVMVRCIFCIPVPHMDVQPIVIKRDFRNGDF